MTVHSTSVNPEEIAKFTAMAETWWDPEGKFAPLHRLNPVRIAYIRDAMMAHFAQQLAGMPTLKPLSGIRILDIGCGGGLLSEPLARLGADVTGIDAGEQNIKTASLHAEKEGVNLAYHCTTAEALLAITPETSYDVVLAMEIIEHVADVGVFMQSVCALVKPGGLLFLATLNRTIKSFMFAIVGAEYVLRWLPRGTHDWRAFLTPSEITLRHLEPNGLQLRHCTGVRYQPIAKTFCLSDDLAVNYMLMAEKPC
ncbi:MAG: bifunctional 2-polyprenyl-6-hydroxyphenol methylase/3-demethylubiquinol 3-O-methyltransferase UbiG [Hyphomicrobiales bacterium]|nr:bifunctional 2-polyprenyl-6-hydroxyphenol methylase/3-demethylubiquinol 3-O-methyltransferase UbiG [Hyphomicrobiales bacterium]